jgi:hypothetical protein
VIDIKTLPLRLIAWGALGIALHVGLARFAYGVVLPSLRNELGLGFTAGGVLNALHLAGYLAGTLMGPMLGRRMGLAQQMRAGNLLTAAGALLCALVPIDFWGDSLLLGAGRLATGLGAGATIIAIMVSVFSQVTESARATASAARSRWTRTCCSGQVHAVNQRASSASVGSSGRWSIPTRATTGGIVSASSGHGPLRTLVARWTGESAGPTGPSSPAPSNSTPNRSSPRLSPALAPSSTSASGRFSSGGRGCDGSSAGA